MEETSELLISKFASFHAEFLNEYEKRISFIEKTDFLKESTKVCLL